MAEKKSFWQTVPGVITGVATILTAALGLIPFFVGGDDNADPQASASPTPGESASPTPSRTSTSRSTEVSEPVALVAPRSLEFGDVGVGRQTQQTVTIANSGSEYLVVEAATITGRRDVYAVEDDEECLVETGIAPRSDCELTVVFSPTSPGSYAGFLEVEHSADGSPTQVALNGQGVLLQL